MAPAQYNNDHLRYSEAPQSNALLSRAASTSTILSTPVSHVPISGVMLTTEVITHLRDHGCQDITKHLDNDSCTAHPISHGGFGDVYLGKLLDGSQVAIKTMRIHVNTDEAQKPLKHAARELYTWSKCQHPNVLGLLGLVEFRNQIGMVSHWMQNGSLLSYLEKQPETDRCRMSAEICKGLVYLHAEKIVHGDLKGPNVLISNDGTPMLTDFGNAILQESTLRFTATTTKYALSARWAAPELMEGLGMHSFAADVYALGMTILETITGKVPYSEKPELGVYMALVKRELPQQPEDFIPPNSENGKELWELLTSCWAHEWEDRPSAAHVADVVSTLSPKGLKKQASVKSNMHGFDPPGSDDRGSLPINNLSPELLVIPPRLTGDNLDTMEDMNIDSVGVEFGQSDSFSQGTVSFSGAVEEVISPNGSREASSPGLNTYSNEFATPATVPPAVVFGPMASYIQQPERANYNSGYQPNAEHTARQNQPVGYGSTSPYMQHQEQAHFTPPVFRAPTMELVPDRLRNMLFLYYFKHVRQIQYVFAGDATTAVMIHHAQMDPHGAVSLALCSLAALHDSRMRIANGIMPNDQRARRPADKYYQNALHQIQGNKLRNGMLTDADATAALHLVSFWLFAGGVGDWPTVLQIAGDWYEQANLSAHENPMRALREMSDNAKHASKTTMWMDIFSSISLGKSPRFLKLYRRLLLPTSVFPGFMGQGLHLENVMGCADGIMLCLAEIADLACWKAEQESKGCLSTLELARRGMIIEAKLRRETQVRSGNQTDTFSGPPGERLGHSISPPSSPPLPSAVLNGEELRRLVSDIFMEAAILYLHTELSGLRPQVAEIKRAVTDTANALAKLPCSEYDRSLVFPLALAGCATDDPEMRDYVRCRIKQLSSAVGNCATAAELIEHVWNRRDSNSGLTIGLREAMCEMGMTILLV